MLFSGRLIEEEERYGQVEEGVLEVQFQQVMDVAWGEIEDKDIDQHQDAKTDVLTELQTFLLRRGHVLLAAKLFPSPSF